VRIPAGGRAWDVGDGLGVDWQRIACVLNDVLTVLGNSRALRR
jgi:hypothetical protein